MNHKSSKRVNRVPGKGRTQEQKTYCRIRGIGNGRQEGGGGIFQ